MDNRFATIQPAEQVEAIVRPQCTMADALFTASFLNACLRHDKNSREYSSLLCGMSSHRNLTTGRNPIGIGASCFCHLRWKDTGNGKNGIYTA